MSGSFVDKPMVAVLTGADEDLPPGLEPLHTQAHVLHVRDRRALTAALDRADVLLVTDFRTVVLAEVWPRRPRVRWVHATSAGVDRLMFPALIDSDIPVTNARGVFDDAIAEFVLAQILIFAKDFLTTFALQRARRWEHRETERIAGRQVLVVGAGSIGRAVARLLRAAGMQVTGVARARRPDDPDFARVASKDDMPALLPEADFVVVATPLTNETRGLFGAAEFRRMRPSARLINIARGAVVQTDALIEALERGEIAGAALDVFEQEPLPAHSRLYELPQVLISAHMAGDFIGWREALSRQFLANFERWRRNEPLQNVVDKQRGYVASRTG